MNNKTTAIDRIEETNYRIAFIQDAICSKSQDNSFSNAGLNGLYFVLEDVQTNLSMAIGDLTENKKIK